MQLSERQQAILEQVQARGFATIEVLAEAFGVSAQTIRRDIIRLDRARLLQRFHGGAGLLREAPVRLGYVQKTALAGDAKQTIARLAADLAPEGAVVYLDVGTTSEAVARRLAKRSGLFVVTNSVRIAGLFAGRSDLQVVVTGGSLRGADGSLVGAEANAAVRQFRFDLAFVGCSGLDAEAGVTDFDPDKVAVKRSAIESAAAAVLLADASKVGRAAVVRIAPLTAFGRLVTDRPLPDPLRQACTAAGCTVVAPALEAAAG
mgnify:CR=1 FL=1